MRDGVDQLLDVFRKGKFAVTVPGTTLGARLVGESGVLHKWLARRSAVSDDACPVSP
jgi:hypothetical protein